MKDISNKVLVVEDEEKIVLVLEYFLESKGYAVITATDGEEALRLFERNKVCLVLLDLMLPKLSGEEVCRAIRKKSQVPIIMITAKSDEEDQLEGLGIGADDYITKPFSLKTLGARMEAVLRRANADRMPLPTKMSFHNGDLTIDLEYRIVKKASQEIKLTPSEYKLLIAMAQSPKKVFTREELIEVAFGYDFDGFDRTIDSHIKNIRHKLGQDPKNPTYLKTVHGVGYKFGGEA